MPMAEMDILQSLIARAGQAQPERALAALDPGSAPLDLRTPEELLRVTRALAARLPYTSTRGLQSSWADFFALSPELLQASATAGETPPQLALFLAFAELYQHPRATLNALTGRHLDHYYREVLRLAPRPAQPDRANLVLETKRGAERTELNSGHRFGAGKDASKRELVYAPVRTTVVGAVAVASLRCTYLEPGAHGRLHCAPVADSADGLGAPLPESDRSWPAFGHASLPPAEVGFAVGAAALRLPGGARTITLELALDAPLRALPAHSFAAFLTGAEGWLGPFEVAPCPAGQSLRLVVVVPAGEAPIVDFEPRVHGYSGAPGAPLMQLLFRGQPGSLGHAEVAGAGVRSLLLSVAVSGLAPASLSNDHGSGDPDKPFQPFGPQPTSGARFSVHCPDVLAQSLTELSLTLEWKDVPQTLSAHYAAYHDSRRQRRIASNDSLRASARFQDGGGWVQQSSVALFDEQDARQPQQLRFLRGAAPSAPADRPPLASLARGRMRLGPAFSKAVLPRAERLTTAVAAQASAPAPSDGDSWPGAIRLRLTGSFLHQQYRALYVAAVLAATKPNGQLSLPAEPYTPTLQSVRLAFEAQAGPAILDSPSEASLSAAAVAFYHVGCFGHRREHRFLRATSPARPSLRVTLLPELPAPGSGALFVGLSAATPGGSVSLLLQLLEGSANPAAPTPSVRWSVLCGDHWRELGPAELALDTTNHLLRSGIVQLQLPAEIRLEHGMLPADLTWLRASSPDAADAFCRLLAVRGNAVEVALVSEGNDPSHLERPLPAGRITTLRTPIASIRQVQQEFASFGGAPAEQPAPFRTRVSERLRHKGRAISAWDYERLVLDAFPTIHRVKCIPHARPGCWLAPGHVLLVTLADLRNQNAVDRLQPRVDADTLARVREFLQRRSGQQVELCVQNPSFERLRLDFRVRFRAGEDFDLRRRSLNEALVRALSPWAFDPERELEFGGAVYRSQLLQLVEELPFVDSVAAFRMLRLTALGSSGDLHFARPTAPDAVLVSEAEHSIAPSA